MEKDMTYVKLDYKRVNWSPAEIKILKEHYPTGGYDKVSPLLLEVNKKLTQERTRVSVQCKASSLKIKKLYERGAAGFSGAMPKETYLEILKETHNNNISLLGEFTGIMKNTEHLCNICNWTWSPKPNKVVNGTKKSGGKNGCPKCAGNFKMTEKVYHEKVRIATQGVVIALDFPPLMTWNNPDGTTGRAKGKYKCVPCGHEWETCVTNVLYQGTKCKKCSGGYTLDYTLPVLLYYVCIDEFYYKIGITNKTIEKRFFRDSNEFREVWSYLYEDAKEALEVETSIKREFKDSFCGSDLGVLSSGNTEMATFDFLGLDNNLTW
jgi:hypothetical protein